MSAQDLISRLAKCRETSRSNWIACCPAHQDKNPSMTIRETEDGHVLAHCFAGCSIDAILAAVGLDFDAVFPPRATHQRKRPQRIPFNAHDVLAVLETECTIVSLLALDIGKGKTINGVERERALLASRRIREAAGLSHGE